MVRQREAPRHTQAMELPETDPVAYPDLSKFKQRTINFQKTVQHSLIPSVEEDNTQTVNTEPINDSEQATKLEQFHHLMKHHGQDLVDYIITLHQHNNDALDLNKEMTGLVDQHEAMQDDLETVKADLAGTHLHTKKLGQELAKMKEGQLRDTQMKREDTGSRSNKKESSTIF